MYVKAVLQGTEMDIRASDAQAVARYIMELDKDATGTAQPVSEAGTGVPDMLSLFAFGLPSIGDSKDFPTPVQGAPTVVENGVGAGNSDSSTFATHTLRVYRQRIYAGDTNNANKVFADVYYASRSRPIIELGSSAVQQKTQTYLTGSNAASGDGVPSDPQTSNDPQYRQQMILDWTIAKGLLAPAGTLFAEDYPPEDMPSLKTVAESSMFRFGTSVRLTSFWFGDEITIPQCNALANHYVACTNKDDLFFPDDAQRWLCTSLPAITTDGGWQIRVSAEFVYSPFGWDSYEVYTYDGQPAILTPEVMGALYKRGQFTLYKNVPDPYVPPHGGAGRFPQQLCRDMTNLVGYMSQGIIFDQPELNAVLTS